jgi:hypothetical protein
MDASALLASDDGRQLTYTLNLTGIEINAFKMQIPGEKLRNAKKIKSLPVSEAAQQNGVLIDVSETYGFPLRPWRALLEKNKNFTRSSPRTQRKKGCFDDQQNKGPCPQQKTLLFTAKN